MRLSAVCIQSIASISLCWAGIGTAFSANYTLEDLILQAMNTYPSIQAKMASKEAAESDLLASKLKFLPSPTFSTQQGQSNYTGKTTNTPATTVGISQPIFAGGGILAGYKKSDSRNTAADFALLETREEIAKRMINAYVEWSKSYAKILALEENVRLHEKFSGMISRRSEGGVASESDQSLGASRLAQARADLDTQRSIEKTSLTSIGQLIGQPIQRSELNKSIARPVVIPQRLVGIEQALDASPTLQKLAHEADAADSEAKEVRAQALPTVNLQAQHQVGNPYVPGAQGYDMVGLVVQFTPGNGFSTIPGASAAASRAKATGIQVDATRRDIVDKLNADYNEHEFSTLKIESLRRSVSLSEDISSSYDRQYLVGRKSWLDLMNAVREQAQTQVALADAEGGLLGSSRRIRISIDGTGNLNATPAPPIREARRNSAVNSNATAGANLASPPTTGSGAVITPVAAAAGAVTVSKIAANNVGNKATVIDTYTPLVYSGNSATPLKSTPSAKNGSSTHANLSGKASAKTATKTNADKQNIASNKNGNKQVVSKSNSSQVAKLDSKKSSSSKVKQTKDAADAKEAGKSNSKKTKKALADSKEAAPAVQKKLASYDNR